MNNVVELLSDVSSDYEKLYESGKYTDISIQVGREPNHKIFLAHSLVLCARSTYFEDKLTGNTEASNEIQHTSMVFEDMTPDIFEILLRFIYTGKVSSHLCEGISWIVLLGQANELGLNIFCTVVGDYLIKQHEQWIKQNILTVYNYALSVDSLQRLGDHCYQLMLTSPDIIKPNDMIKLPKATFFSLLKNDQLSMDEGNIWKSAVLWAINQISGLTDDPSNWSSIDVNAIKNIMTECLPHIRFFNMSSKTFDKVVVPYIELLPRELRSDLLHYHLQTEYKPETQMLLQRTGQLADIDTVIINKQQVSWILQRIAEAKQKGQVKQRATIRLNRPGKYKLTLLYRDSRDCDMQNRVKTFRQKCTNKGPTIAVGRVKDTEEILGGYNPLAWSIVTGGTFRSTKESFVFSLDKNDIEKSIISFVVKEEDAIYDDQNFLPAFAFGPCALFFGGYEDEKGTLTYSNPVACNSKVYQPPIRSTFGRFTWVDWEVFSVDELTT